VIAHPQLSVVSTIALEFPRLLKAFHGPGQGAGTFIEFPGEGGTTGAWQVPFGGCTVNADPEPTSASASTMAATSDKKSRFM
jgi:hypothetical protein